MNNEKPINIPLSGLWQNVDKNGNTYFTGSLGNARLVIFKNTRKENEKQPDYIMFVSPNKPKKEETDNEDFNDAPF